MMLQVIVKLRSKRIHRAESRLASAKLARPEGVRSPPAQRLGAEEMTKRTHSWVVELLGADRQSEPNDRPIAGKLLLGKTNPILEEVAKVWSPRFKPQNARWHEVASWNMRIVPASSTLRRPVVDCRKRPQAPQNGHDATWLDCSESVLKTWKTTKRTHLVHGRLAFRILAKRTQSRCS